MIKAHLVSYYGAAGGSGVCCDDNAAIVETADDGGTGGCGLGEWDALCVESAVAVVIAEVEARHVVWWWCWCSAWCGIRMAKEAGVFECGIVECLVYVGRALDGT